MYMYLLGEKAVATKTITVDTEAYRRLRMVRRKDESFSRAIKRVVRPPLDVDAYLARLDAAPLSANAARAVEKRASTRKTRTRRNR